VVNATIYTLTLKQLLARRRTLLMLAFAMLPVVLAIISRPTVEGFDRQEWTIDVLNELVIASLLPMIALVFGTAAHGADVEDGTAFYILAKPIPRLEILLSRLAAALTATAGMVGVSTFACGLIGLWGEPQEGIASGFLAGALAGSLAYCCLFVLLSVLTTRALIAGLIYVFLWEAIISRIFDGLRVFSVRQYSLGVADGVSSVEQFLFAADLSFAPAIVLTVLVSIACTWYAGRRLESFELRDTV
jgi:ABC-2 type transport system permease protein